MRRLLFVGLVAVLMPSLATAQSIQCAGPFGEPAYQEMGSTISKSVAENAIRKAQGAVLPGFGRRLERLHEMHAGFIHDFFDQMLAAFRNKPVWRGSIQQFSRRYYQAEREDDQETTRSLRQVLFTCFPALGRASIGIAAIEAQERIEEVNRRDEAKKREELEKEAAALKGEQLLQEANRKEALERTPLYMLGNSYINYIRLKKCEAVRHGYATIFISDAEMERARVAVKRLEEKLGSQIGVDKTGKQWTTEAMWEEANHISARDAVPTRESCQTQYRALLDRFRSIFPDAGQVSKDF